jgi:UPF0716 family protein affecting phage T7 exclusion
VPYLLSMWVRCRGGAKLNLALGETHLLSLVRGLIRTKPMNTTVPTARRKPNIVSFAGGSAMPVVDLYELSRQREQGLNPSWQNAFDVLHSPSRGAIAALGFLLLVIFVLWVAVAQAIYIATFGYQPAASVPDFVRQVFNTPAGWKLIIIGNGIGFLFALAVLAISVVSFPLLLDRDVGAVEAALTSLRAVAANPIPMAVWGLIVAGLLVIGSVPFFVGLAIVLPPAAAGRRDRHGQDRARRRLRSARHGRGLLATAPAQRRAEGSASQRGSERVRRIQRSREHWDTGRGRRTWGRAP